MYNIERKVSIQATRMNELYREALLSADKCFSGFDKFTLFSGTFLKCGLNPGKANINLTVK